MKSRLFLLTLCLVLPLASCTPPNTFEESANQTATSTDAAVEEALVPAEQQSAETAKDAAPAEKAAPADAAADDAEPGGVIEMAAADPEPEPPEDDAYG